MAVLVSVSLASAVDLAVVPVLVTALDAVSNNLSASLASAATPSASILLATPCRGMPIFSILAYLARDAVSVVAGTGATGVSLVALPSALAATGVLLLPRLFIISSRKFVGGMALPVVEGGAATSASSLLMLPVIALAAASLPLLLESVLLVRRLIISSRKFVGGMALPVVEGGAATSASSLLMLPVIALAAASLPLLLESVLLVRRLIISSRKFTGGIGGREASEAPCLLTFSSVVREAVCLTDTGSASGETVHLSAKVTGDELFSCTRSPARSIPGMLIGLLIRGVQDPRRAVSRSTAPIKPPIPNPSGTVDATSFSLRLPSLTS